MQEGARRVLHVHHDTHYAYREPVQQAYHLAFLRPCEGIRQSVLARSFRIEPAPDVEHEVLDPFGNWRHFFALHTPHRALRVSSRFRVHVAEGGAPPAAARALSWRSVREALSYAAGRRYEPASEFGFASPYVPHDDTLRDYALEVFAGEAGLVTACERFNQRIFEEFRYAPSATGVDTPTLEAFRRREGVCQDFAHIMIAGLRSLGLSARYVSGYLLTRPPAGQPRRRGVDASHAWVAVYCPGAEGNWLEFDPTNGIAARQEHVRLAYGRDFGDVSPLRGVIQGGGEHRLKVAVTVEEATGTEAQTDPDQDSTR
ncbi:MAG: transglutaminase family protein [Betaproteobacteria bacterium]|nr:transglutaminase family protein [Betaproteobacteria bacterium]